MKLATTLIALIFCLQASAQFKTILNFDGTNGRQPPATLISDGTYLYGMTYYGGFYDNGVLFKIKPNGTGYVDLMDFDELSGDVPYGTLYSDGTWLYGTTTSGGANEQGSIFKIKPNGTGFVKLWDFDFTHGGGSFGALISDGTFLYGTTTGGGATNNGVIFKIKPDGTEYADIFDFAANDTIGGNPDNALYYDGTYLYGTTQFGGAYSQGTLFKIKPNGTGFVNLLDFTGGANGGNPNGYLISDGTWLYGMTGYGGANADGTVFKIKPDGSDYTKLLDFDGASNGRISLGSLVTDGTYLYGMNARGGANDGGTIFKIKPDGSGYEKLADFGGSPSGISPWGTMLMSRGVLYGVTSRGGTNDMGTIFSNGCNSAVGGHLTAERDTICQGTPGSLTLAGSSGNLLRWQMSTDSINYTNTSAGDTTVKYVTMPLQQTTWFRVAVDTGNCNALSDTVKLYVPPALTASFSYSNDGKTVTFNADSSKGNIISYNWDFGDGATGIGINPVNIYDRDTAYTACLTIYDGSNCSYTYCRNVDLRPIGVATISTAGYDAGIYPNPTGKLLVVSYGLPVNELIVTDVLGRTLFTRVATGKKTTIDVSNLSTGIYLLQVKSKGGLVVKKFVKE